MPTKAPHRSKPTQTRIRSGLVLFLALCPLPRTSRAGDAPAAPAGDAVLHLKNGGYVPGVLNPSEELGLIRWQSPSFAAPFVFGTGAVNAIHFPVPATLPRPEGEYC